MMKQRTSKKLEVANVYAAKISHIDAMLKRLQAANDEHLFVGIDELNWGHVGLVSDIEEKLNLISNLVFKEGEHA